MGEYELSGFSLRIGIGVYLNCVDCIGGKVLGSDGGRSVDCFGCNAAKSVLVEKRCLGAACVSG